MELRPGTRFKRLEDSGLTKISHYYNYTGKQQFSINPPITVSSVEHEFEVIRVDDVNDECLCSMFYNGVKTEYYIIWSKWMMENHCEGINSSQSSTFNRGTGYTKDSPWEFL